MDAMDLLLQEGYTHYQCMYHTTWDDETWKGDVYPIEPLNLTAKHFQDNWEDSADIAEVILLKL